VSEKSVSRYVASGRLLDRRVKGALDVLPEDVERLKAELETPVVAPETAIARAPVATALFVPSHPVTARGAGLTLESVALAVVALGEQMNAGHSATGQDAAPVRTSEKLTLSLDEAAALSGFSSRRLRQAITEGKLHAVRIGRGYKLRGEDLKAFVNTLFDTKQ